MKDKIYVVPEEDTGEEMEFVKTSELLAAFNLVDSTGLVSKILGQYFRYTFLLSVLEKLGWSEDAPESKKHLNYSILNLKSKRILNRLNAFLDK
jgi:hypothetical protein